MTSWTQKAMESRLVRYDDLVPCEAAFLDSRTPGSELEEPPSPARLAAWATPPMTEMGKGLCRACDMAANAASPLAAKGIEECGIVNLIDTADGFPAGPVEGGWQHGFALRQLRMAGGAHIPRIPVSNPRWFSCMRASSPFPGRKVRSSCGEATRCRFRRAFLAASGTAGGNASSPMSCAAATIRPPPGSNDSRLRAGTERGDVRQRAPPGPEGVAAAARRPTGVRVASGRSR